MNSFWQNFCDQLPYSLNFVFLPNNSYLNTLQMRKLPFLFTLVLLIIAMSFTTADSKRTLPSVNIKTLNGKVFNTKNITNDTNAIIISFWATWCKPCVQELNSISEVYEEWQEETGVKLVAISIDNSRTSIKVKPLVNGQEWDYEVYLDENGDFKRAMGVNMVPHTFILNGKGEIVWQHTTFSEGGELEMIDIIRKIKNGEEIK